MKSGKGKDELGTYYFQTKPDPSISYIKTLAGEKWEDWSHKWVIARNESSERLVLPIEGPSADRKL